MNTHRGKADGRRRQRGFTLLEMVIAIVITGILGGMVAVFIKGSIDAYFDATRRAKLVETADTTLRRIGRDLRQALPNSIAVSNSAGRFYVEYVQVKGGGRYRYAKDVGTDDELAFDAADASFDVLGPMPAVAGGDRIVIGNLGQGSAGDVYAGNNIATVGSVGGSRVTLTAAKLFPVDSCTRDAAGRVSGCRFYVVDAPVTYECDPVNGRLRRYWGYALRTPVPAPPAGGSSADLVAAGVTDCAFAMDAVATLTRMGIISMRIQLSADNEHVPLFFQAHVSNVP